MEREIEFLGNIDNHPVSAFSIAIKKLHNQAEKLIIPPQTRIGIIAEQTLETAAAIWFILSIGCVFVPVEESYPRGIQRQMLKESGCKMLIQKGTIHTMDTKPYLNEQQDELAYIVFTSGSTGKPKGVKVSKDNLNNYIRGLESLLSLSKADRILITTSMAFDLAYTGLFMAFKNTCWFDVASKAQVSDPNVLLDVIINEKITFLKITPTLLVMLVAINRKKTWIALKYVRLLLLGGEPIDATLIAELLEHVPSLTIVNHYGPCETTIGCCAKVITSKNRLIYQSLPTIGKPFANNNIAIIDDALQEVPFGQVGRLLVFGKGVGMGYLQNNTSDTGYCIWNNQSAFLTSDIGYWTSNGEIALCGRQETIAKWKGYRLPLQEITQTIQSIKGIDKAYVTIKNISGREMLICYYIGNKSLSYASFREYLNDYLPIYMIPSRFFRVKQFYYNANGKITPEKMEVMLSRGQTKFYGIEKQIYECWLSAGGAEDIDRGDSFFLFGMDSLMMVEFVVELEETFPLVFLSHSLIANFFSIELLGKYLSQISRRTQQLYFDDLCKFSLRPEEYFYSFQTEIPELTFYAFPTQRYYYYSGFCNDIVMHKVLPLPYDLHKVSAFIKRWIIWDSSLRTAIKGEICTTYPANAVKNTPLCVVPLDFDDESWKNVIVSYEECFMKSDFGFFPLCVPLSEKNTLCIFFFRHILCRSGAVDTFFAMVQGAQFPDLSQALQKLTCSNDVYSSQLRCDSFAFDYWQTLGSLSKRYFKPLHDTKCVSTYRSYSIIEIYKITSRVDLLIAWASACVLGELLKEKAIPISIWKNKGYQTVLEASAWDLSDFEYYIINVDPSQSGLYVFLETAHLKDRMFDWQMNDMLRACENDIPLDNIYLNIINKKNDCLETNLQNTKEVTLVQTELDSRKISSIHGICLYGEINSKTKTLRLCYSANYNIVDAERFIELLDHLIQSLMKRV